MTKMVAVVLTVMLLAVVAGPVFADTTAPAAPSPYVLEYGTSDSTVGWTLLGLLLFFIFTSNHSGTGPTCGKACP